MLFVFLKTLILCGLNFLAAAVALAAASSQGAPKKLHCFEGAEMGTPFKVCAYIGASELAKFKVDAEKSFISIKKIDAWMSDWRPSTALSQVNARAGRQRVQVGPELFSVLEYALFVSRVSNGAFDPTFNVFWGLYNFKKGKTRQPTQAEIDQRLSLIDYKNVVLNKSEASVFLKKKGMKLGLGAIGQGYAVDKVVEKLRKKYSAGYVDGSGDTYFWGQKPSGELWTTAIRDPRDHSQIIGRVYGTDFAITTCGDDEKFFFDKDGKRVHHIIDPKTGHSARASRQVTVIAKTALAADAFDTASFVLGPKKAKPLLEKMGMQGVFITDNEVIVTSGIEKKQTRWGEVLMITSALKDVDVTL